MLAVVTLMQFEWQELYVGMSLPYIRWGTAWILSVFVIFIIIIIIIIIISEHP